MFRYAELRGMNVMLNLLAEFEISDDFHCKESRSLDRLCSGISCRTSLVRACGGNHGTISQTPRGGMVFGKVIRCDMCYAGVPETLYSVSGRPAATLYRVTCSLVFGHVTVHAIRYLSRHMNHRIVHHK